MNKTPTPFQAFKLVNRPGVTYSPKANKAAGKLFASGHSTAALKILDDDKLDSRNEFDGHAPVHLNLLVCPEHVLPLEASRKIQEHVLSLCESDIRAAFLAGGAKTPGGLTKLNATNRPKVYEKLKIKDKPAGLYAQTENSILNNALHRFWGEIVKAENRNTKNRLKHEQACRTAAFWGRKAPDAPEEESALDELGKLKHRPGIESKHYIANDYSIEAYSADRHPHLKLKVKYQDPSQPIPRLSKKDAAEIHCVSRLRRLAEKLAKSGRKLDATGLEATAGRIGI